MASDFVRQISSPFTTRLALVFASWADENKYSYRNRTRRICCFSQESFFLSTSKQLLKKCLKCLKRLEALLGTFRESKGTEQSLHSTARLFSEAVPLIRREIFPSMYVRNLQQEKGIEKILNAARTELYRMGLEGGSAIPCPAEETELSITLANSCFLMQNPDYWSAVPVRTQRVLQLLASAWQSHVSS